MKKFLVLASCVVAILIACYVSFAQEGLVDPADPAPCACSEAPAAPAPVAAPVPFAYPPYPYAPPRLFGYRRAMRAMAFAAPMAAPEAMPYPYGMNPRIARRAARMAAFTQPPYPIPSAPAPMIAGTVPAGVPTEGSPYASPFAPYGSPSIGSHGQTGKWNISFQRSGTTGPVINFLSIVRPNPYATYPMPVVQ